MEATQLPYEARGLRVVLCLINSSLVLGGKSYIHEVRCEVDVTVWTPIFFLNFSAVLLDILGVDIGLFVDTVDTTCRKE